MARGGSDDSHWDLDSRAARDDQREPRRHRGYREPVRLSRQGTLKQIFVGRSCIRCGETLPPNHAGVLCPFFCVAKVLGRTKDAELDRCYACGARAIGTAQVGAQLERACSHHMDGAQ